MRRIRLRDLATGAELIGVLVGAFLFNLIPFAGPSNLLIASNAAVLTDSDPFTIGFLVALGSTFAKLVQYVITYFVGGHLNEQRKKRLCEVNMKLGKWSFLALFIAAATPIPDEPVVVPLGLMKYNPAKFSLALFLGKISITIFGAYLGKASQSFLSSIASHEVLTILSIVLTVIVTIALLKVNIPKIFARFKPKPQEKTDKQSR
jgi:membrane protein YqaA with SNARE-associated domain